MTDKIRWGILATGGIAATFTRDLATLPDAEVAAVGSRSIESATRFADQFGIPRAYGSWAELAADDSIDVVYVATPHNAHHEAAKLCLDAGKAVLCEKAFTVNLAQARELVELARTNSVFLMEAMWMRTIPAIRRMTELIADGAIGEVRVVSASFGLMGPFDADHRLRSPDLAGGALLDLGVYPVSLAQLVLGPPRSITATARLTPEGVDETTGILLDHDGGAMANLSCSISAGAPMTALISGSTGWIDLGEPFFRPKSLIVNRRDSVETFDVPHTAQGMVHEAVEVMRCLRDGELESPLVPWQASLDVMATLDEVRRQIGVVYPGE